MQIRPLSKLENDFVWNDWNLSACDFNYWMTHYARIILDDATGRRGNIKPTPAQEIILSRMSTTEERMWRELDAGRDRFDGQCYFMHKAGQMGISTHSELVGCHLLNFYPDTMGLVASADDQKTQKVYTDYMLSVYDSLPPWMRSPLRSKTKDRGLDFVSGSAAVLQDASQKSGLGQGSKWHFVHVTELASWPDPVTQFEKHLLPRISWSIKATAFAESNSQGLRDWWHDHTELARRGEYNRWQYIFIGWWMVPQFRHRYPPADWSPAKHTLEEAELIVRRSSEFTSGYTVTPTREMMYWWESERAQYERSGTLNEFYKEHPSVPEQSFTHSGRSSFSVETLESLERGCSTPIPYEIATRDTPSELVITEWEDVRVGSKTIRVPPPKIHTIGKHDLVPIRINPRDLSTDPRGLILLWEEPSQRHDYFGGVDTAGGIANWSRYIRHKHDGKNDNAVIQIVRRGFYGNPDVQVCEFAAPIFSQDLALYCSLLGRLYHGREESECLLTVEINLYGAACQNELIEKYDYQNLYVRRRSDDGVVVNFMDKYGWHTNSTSIYQLWTLGKKHVAANRFKANSHFLVSEMRDCADDNITGKLARNQTRGKAEGGSRHDDRVYALLFALEGAHSFTGNLWNEPDPRMKPVIIESSPRRASFTERDYTFEEYNDMLADWEDSLGEL